MGTKISNDISSESAHHIDSQKFLHTPKDVCYQNINERPVLNIGQFVFIFP